ncbi:hypothetical protein ABID58_001430 [Bradyrhizobium sp. S3.2.6]|uniref:hypothetical protein n=1 Tax=Bradyrhizobium sp. S3.2.6 TaxID=3156428 RepID=UPI00339A5CC1
MSVIWQWPVERGEIITDTNFETRIRVVVDQLLTLIGEGRSIEKPALPFHRTGQQCWLEEHRRRSHVERIGDRWPDTLATHPPPH